MSMEQQDNHEWYALSQNGVEYLKFCVSNDPDTYIKDAILSPTPELYTVAEVARVFDVPGESRANYVASNNARAVMSGEMLGMEVAAEFLTIDAFKDVLQQLKRLTVPIGIMSAQRRHEVVRQKILDVGLVGWEVAADVYGELFDYWNSSLTSDDTDGLMIRFGFGLIIEYMEEAREKELDRISRTEFGEGRLDDYLQSILERGK